MKLPQKEWRGRSRINEQDRASFIGPWRWDPKADPVFGKLEKLYDASWSAIEGVKNTYKDTAEKLAAENLKTRQYTDDGLRMAAAEAVFKSTGPASLRALQRGRAELDRIKAEVAARFGKLTLPAPKNSDPATVALREEIRRSFATRASTMKSEEWYAALKDPVVREAIISAPAFLSGIPASMHAAAVAETIEQHHGAEISAIREIGEAIDTIERLVGEGRKEVRNTLRQIDAKRLDEIEQTAEPVNMRVSVETVNGKTAQVVRVMDTTTRSWRRATDAEIASYRERAA